MANGARFYILQVHYYNPGLTAGVFDSSGVRMSLAPALRTHVARRAFRVKHPKFKSYTIRASLVNIPLLLKRSKYIIVLFVSRNLDYKS